MEEANKIIIINSFLHEIKDVVLEIDGGCYNCIQDFCIGINDVIAKYGISMELEKECEKKTINIKVIL